MEGGVEGLGRVEQLLTEGDIVVLLQRTEDTEVYRKTIVEGLLRDVELGNVGTEVIGLYYRLVVHHTY